jgi:hypothetical protein
MFKINEVGLVLIFLAILLIIITSHNVWCILFTIILKYMIISG